MFFSKPDFTFVSSNSLHLLFWCVIFSTIFIFTCFYTLFDIVFMEHNVVYVFVILVDDVYCVAIHDLSPALTALFSLELLLGGLNSY